GGVYIVPAFAGLGAPYWDMYARGTITGLTRGSNKNHIVRAALESIAYQTNDLIKAMKSDCGIEITSLKADGGAAENKFLMQFQADISDVTIIKPECAEATALGAAFLAGLSVGFWKDKDEILAIPSPKTEFCPKIAKENRNNLLCGWQDAINRTKR
ncbi:MAG: glycerol kinase, partial [Clostridia bacterium]|nr:glycerol kinase [Clostridia bacterium]